MEPAPDAYTIGWIPFLGATIHLDSRPLIPRTETEWWVEQFIKKASAHSRHDLRILDLCAGSGCIGVAVLKHLNAARVDFGEKEERHLPTIEKNVHENGVGDRSAVFQTDMYSNVSASYDYILANPPYLSRERIGRVEESVLQHEPIEALFAADDGFELIQKLLSGLPKHLKRGGEAWIEHEPEHTGRIQGAVRALGFTVHTKKDQYGVERFSVILWS